MDYKEYRDRTEFYLDEKLKRERERKLIKNTTLARDMIRMFPETEQWGIFQN